MARPKGLLVEIDGPGVTPKTVDTLLLLRLAEASFRLAIKVAEAGNLGLSFRGIDVIDKCVAVVAIPSNAKAARLAARRTLQLVRGIEIAPPGAEATVRDVRSQLRLMPENFSARFVAGRWSGLLRAPEMPVLDRPWERTELRVRPLRVGGAQNPRALLASESEPEPFIIEASRDFARKLGAALYQEIDVTLDICRDVDGLIEQGKIVDVVGVSDYDPAGQWRSWFATNADWGDVDNVLEGLDRRID